MAQLNSLLVTGDSRFLNPINGNARNGIYYVKGTQTLATGSWTGNIPIPALYDGLTIMYYLPYAGSGNATLNLTLSTGATTGAINCYINGSSRLTTHFSAGSSFKLTYYSAGSITVSGTATTDNRWVTEGQWNTTYNFSGTTFYSGASGTAEHNANNAVKNGHYYYSSNGPTTTLGASSTDGALYVQSFSDAWVGQIAQDYRNGNIFVRGKNNGTWTDWKKVDAGTINGQALPTSAASHTTGISIAAHTTTNLIGVQSTTTTASKVTKGTDITIPNITEITDVTVPIAASSATTVPIKNASATSIPNVTAVGSGSFTSGTFTGGSGSFGATVTDGVLSFSHTHTAATHGADSHTHTPPTLGTAISIIGVQSSTTSVTGVSGSTTASKVTQGAAITIPNITNITDVTVPIKNASATAVVTSTGHTITDNGHTHNLS